MCGFQQSTRMHHTQLQLLSLGVNKRSIMLIPSHKNELYQIDSARKASPASPCRRSEEEQEDELGRDQPALFQQEREVVLRLLHPTKPNMWT